jgi:hypothetical protein
VVSFLWVSTERESSQIRVLCNGLGTIVRDNNVYGVYIRES